MVPHDSSASPASAAGNQAEEDADAMTVEPTAPAGPSPHQALDFADMDSGLSARILDGLESVEEMLSQATASDDFFVGEVASHLAFAGGKRFRPLLALLSAEFGDPHREEVVKLATVMELTHLATLYHDDVMDEAPRRRGAPSANQRWDNTIAILAGDFLFARASEILADLGADTVRIQAQTFARLCTGQIRETVGPTADQDPVQHHIDVLADKTGSLIEASCRLGSRVAGVERPVEDALAAFGENIGVAFQLADDLVDILSDGAQSGKTPGTDIREGVPTLATLILLRDGTGEDARLVELLSRPLPDDAEHAEALRLLREHRVLDAARTEAARWAAAARDSLEPLPDIPAKDAMNRLCDYVVQRTA